MDGPDVAFDGFPVAALDFYDDLEMDNTKSFWTAHKEVYDTAVKAPMTALVEALEPEFGKAKLFRPYRDVRFAKDKTPYKTHCGIQFRHARTRDVHAPGFYLHLEPGSVFMACGVWHPERDTLHAIRTAIAVKPKRWTEITDGLDGFRLGGESLKRPPAGFDRDHPLIEELKRKDFMAIADMSEQDALASGFLDEFIGRCEAADDFMRFLCDATRVAY